MTDRKIFGSILAVFVVFLSFVASHSIQAHAFVADDVSVLSYETDDHSSEHDGGDDHCLEQQDKRFYHNVRSEDNVVFEALFLSKLISNFYLCDEFDDDVPLVSEREFLTVAQLFKPHIRSVLIRI